MLARSLGSNVVMAQQPDANMGLGTNDPENMESVELKLGPPAKEEDGKAVDPAHSYKTQWGSIKSTSLTH